MKEANQNSKEREIAEEQIDFRALLFKYSIFQRNRNRAIFCNCYIFNGKNN